MHSTPTATDGSTGQKFSLQHLAIKVAIPLGIMSVALYGLSHFTTGVSAAEIRDDALSYDATTLALSLLAMLVSYALLGLYDALIMPTVSSVKVPFKLMVATGASSMAISNLFGFSWLTGGALRFKVYTARGVSICAIAKLMATAWAAFFAGLWVIIGIVMVINPSGFVHMLPMPSNFVMLTGAAMLTLMFGYFKWTWQNDRMIHVGPLAFSLPEGKLGVNLTVVTVLDLAATALTLYVLLPPDLTQDFIYFIGLFVVALGLGVLSHSPGGLGVFDATIIAGLGAMGRSDVMVAIALYRVVYTIIPATLSLISVVFIWLYAHRARMQLAILKIHKSCAETIPIAAAGLATFSGAVLLLSGSFPSDPSRLRLMRQALPLELVEASHLLGSVSGVLLMIVAHGLYRRMFRAWLVAMVLFAVGLLVSILKGFDWEEATTLAFIMGVLWIFRAAFYCASFQTGPTLNWRWIGTVCALTVAIVWIGLFANSQVPLNQVPWWEFAWQGDASRFVRATLAISVVLAALLLNALLTKQATRLRPEPIPAVVRNLVKQSTFAEAGISLSGDKRFVVSPDNKAFLAYADTGSSLICKGDPVGDKDACVTVLWQFRELADQMGRKCAFYRVSDAYLPTFLDLGMQILKIGEVARIELANFNLQRPKRRAWRNGKLRVEAEGYQFEIIPTGSLNYDFEQLRTVSDAWLAQKLGQEKGFSLGSFSRTYLDEFDIGVLRHTETGKITAFANIMKTGNTAELSIDLMRYDPAGPVSSMDGLFAGMLLWGHENGYRNFCLGASPLSGLEQRRLAPVWHRIGHFLFHNGESFYKFAGLSQFKQKFAPNWSPEYLTVANKMDVARVLYEVSVLISKGPQETTRTAKTRHVHSAPDLMTIRSISAE